jgi:hypothetical protein
MALPGLLSKDGKVTFVGVWEQGLMVHEVRMSVFNLCQPQY